MTCCTHQAELEEAHALLASYAQALDAMLETLAGFGLLSTSKRLTKRVEEPQETHPALQSNSHHQEDTP